MTYARQPNAQCSSPYNLT